MALLTFPYSPLPANLSRIKDWGENTTRYDSGEQQSDTPYVKPLYQWTVPIKLYTEVHQALLSRFWDQVRATTDPFLIKDAYDLQVNSVLGVRSGITNAATLFLYDTNSYMVRCDTTTIGSLFSTLSGYVALGTQYGYDQDSGLLTVNTKATADVWGVRSMQYYRKAKFSTPMNETSQLWNIFATQLTIVELP